MGITTPLSTNAAMTIGGLKIGVTPLDMAHAYETIAQGGRRTSGSLAAAGTPVGIQEVRSPDATLPDGSHVEVNRVESRRVLPEWITKEETEALETVITSGTGTAASIGQFATGKTGTTTNYGDAWFVGFDSKYTVAVWVGYPNKLVPMTTDFNGGPVYGGTYPALIWKNFMLAAIALEENHGHATTVQPSSTSTYSSPATTTTTTTGSPHSETHTETKAPATATPAPATKAPAAEQPAATPTPAPPPTQPSGGGGGGTSSGGVGAG
jgi:penicillin-binding protein 1A